MADSEFARSTLIELLNCMRKAQSPWRYNVLAAWAEGDFIYLVHENTATELIIGDVISVEDSLESYGNLSAEDLANIIFAADIESHPYREISFANSGLNSRNSIYWFGSTAETQRVRSIHDISDEGRPS
ncbi:hypothetical protein [Mycolicibacterium sp. HS_4_1]